MKIEVGTTIYESYAVFEKKILSFYINFNQKLYKKIQVLVSIVYDFYILS